ncbi:hypothetical protein CERZMDRAFT_97080 [Cercospora zeae-maydis SCOH1-5]|uniref:Uncharacterized protein n=1 Tax=Cercospora zeae-maydis SCOH1-5 TaxID=717836 RepID=A0A6A6FGS5_9PEZI|nr:hypothetical protein CERZMDRAFT_97080 [Cercospora zeae-maydis SCOH1-5]
MTTVTTTATGVLSIDRPSSVNDLEAMETPPGLKCYDDRKPWHQSRACHRCHQLSEPGRPWSPSPSIEEQGNISVSISVVTDKCNPIQVVGSVASNANLRIPFNACDIDGYGTDDRRPSP